MKGFGRTAAGTAAAAGSPGMRAGRAFPVITVSERLGPFPEDSLSLLRITFCLTLTFKFFLLLQEIKTLYSTGRGF